MKYLLVFCLFVFGASSRADVVTTNTAGTIVSFTNSQSNFSWTPTALAFLRNASEPVAISIFRHGNGQILQLAAITATASNLIWIPEGAYTFGEGSALVVTSSLSNFSVQLHRGPAQ